MYFYTFSIAVFVIFYMYTLDSMAGLSVRA